jgi:parallel beta-helix repeat protein
MVVLTATVAVLAVSGTEASSARVNCGGTITADTTLDADFLHCPNNGIVIGADNVTLDMNGHTVAGDGRLVKRCPRGQFCDVGLLNDGHDGVTVTGGSVRDFAIGAFVGKARHNHVLDISSSRNDFFGIVFAESAQSVIRDSSGSGNPAPEGDGMGLFGSHNVRILDNSFHDNALGIHVEDSTDNVIRGNLFARNAGFGIFMEGDRNQVRRNRCVRNTTCVLIGSGRRNNVIARNRIFGGSAGVGIENGRGNLVVRNVVGETRVVGIYLGLEEPPIGGVDNVVRRNLVRGSDGDGFKVNEKVDRSLLIDNTASGAGDDGFDVRSRSTKLTGNRGVRNADLGIEAVRGVIDSGDNRAGENGDERDCVNVRCR